MTAIINNQRTENGTTDFDSIKSYIKSAKDMGIVVKGIDINMSQKKFVPVSKNKTIIYGFGLVKGLTDGGINIIDQNRPFNTYKDFIKRVGLQLNKADVNALIKSGAFTSISDWNKMKMFKLYYSIRFDNKKEDKKPINKVNKTHIKWLYENGYIDSLEVEDKDECTNLINKIRKSQGWKDYQDKYCQGTELDWEMETLNTYLSANPFDGVILPDWKIVDNEDIGYVGGIVTSVKETTIKNGKSKGQKMCFINVSCDYGVVDIVVFSKEYAKYKELLKAGKCLVCKVKKQGDLKGVFITCRTLHEYLELSADIQKKEE